MKCDAVASGIVEALQKQKQTKRIIVRLEGKIHEILIIYKEQM